MYCLKVVYAHLMFLYFDVLSKGPLFTDVHCLKDLYAELSEQCKKYSCNLLDQCRSSEEVIAVLNRSSESSRRAQRQEEIDDDLDDDEERDEDEEKEKLTLDRFKLAIKYEQKQVSNLR